MSKHNPTTGIHSDNGSGRLTSYVGGKAYHFPYKVNDSGSKAAAKQARAQSDAQLIAAQDSRAVANLGRIATGRETAQGLQLPLVGTPSDRIRAGEMDHRDDGRAKNRDPDRNYSAERVQKLEASLLVTPERLQAPIYRRLAQARIEAERFQQALDSRNARQAILSRPDVVTARQIGESVVAQLSVSPRGDSQRFLEQAQGRLARLLETGDVDEFYEGDSAFRAERATIFSHQEAALREQAATIKQEADALKAQRLAPPVV